MSHNVVIEAELSEWEGPQRSRSKTNSKFKADIKNKAEKNTQTADVPLAASRVPRRQHVTGSTLQRYRDITKVKAGLKYTRQEAKNTTLKGLKVTAADQDCDWLIQTLP